jgi:hypothetical protein
MINVDRSLALRAGGQEVEAASPEARMAGAVLAPGTPTHPPTQPCRHPLPIAKPCPRPPPRPGFRWAHELEGATLHACHQGDSERDASESAAPAGKGEGWAVLCHCIDCKLPRTRLAPVRVNLPARPPRTPGARRGGTRIGHRGWLITGRRGGHGGGAGVLPNRRRPQPFSLVKHGSNTSPIRRWEAQTAPKPGRGGGGWGGA